LLGFLTLGLALALRTVIASAVAWLYIISRHPFHIGDRVQVGGYVGHVVDIEVFHFRLIELKDWHGHALPTGRIVRVPNNLIFQTTVAGNVAGFPYHWDEIEVQFAHGSDLESAKRLLSNVVARHAVAADTLDTELRRRMRTEFMMPDESLAPAPVVRIDPSGIKITVRYLSKATHGFAIEEAIWVDLLAAAANEPNLTLVGIEIPTPQAEQATVTI
jgi:small-conductance mechanosensitive channel